MKLVSGLLALAALAGVATAAQAQYPPPGSYQNQCRRITMMGQFLSAYCRGGRGYEAQSSINVLSCSGDIGVDYEGGLICQGPGAGAGRPPQPVPYPPPDGRPPPAYDRYSVTIYERFGFKGRSMRIDSDMSNLDGTGFNDRIASIRLRKRSGPWLACEDSNFRGRCVTIGDDTRDLGQLGMLNSVSSLRPLR